MLHFSVAATNSTPYATQGHGRRTSVTEEEAREATAASAPLLVRACMVRCVVYISNVSHPFY